MFPLRGVEWYNSGKCTFPRCLSLHLMQANKDKNKLVNQMNSRNEELLKQKDVNDILRTTLGKGEVEYNKRIDDIRLLKLEVKRLR